MRMFFDVGTAETTGYSADGWLGVHVDPFGGDEGGQVAYPVIGSYGFLGRPLQPSFGLGAQTLYAQQGHDGFAWIGHDPRDVAKLPQLTEGSAAIYNARGMYQLFDYDTETATMYVPMGDGSKAHAMTVGYDPAGKRTLSIIHSDGFAVVMTETSLTIKNAAGDAYVELNADGIVLNGNVKLVGGLDTGGGLAVPLTNNTSLIAWWGALVAATNALGPTTPLTAGILGTLFAGMTAGLTPVGTTLTKGI